MRSMDSGERTVRNLSPCTASGDGSGRTLFHSSRNPPEPSGGSTLTGTFFSKLAACSFHRSDR